tara:strand:- start:2621 stop:2809 length:189 start_codon:yes stop_codon:yes gene_type:complete
MRNKELVDRRFIQVEGKIKQLKFLVGGQGTAQEFKDTLKDLETVVEDLKSIIERDLDPLRNG